MKKFFISVLTLAALVANYSCSSDNDSGTETPQTDGTISSQNDPDLDPTNLKGNVVADVKLTAGEWTLTGPLSVKDGYTLTIDPGTTIKAEAGGTNVYLVIEQGAKINAVGNSSNPIIFRSNATNPQAGDWGGIILNGKAKISGGGTSTTEVLPLTYGGTNDNDNSGVMSYVVIEHTGARINGEKEFNGLTLYAVGSQTQINNIVINKGDDDSIEFFGGTVSVTNLLAVDARDDLFDWTQGYRGTANSNWYGVRTTGFTAISEDTRGIEGDGNLDGNSPGDADQSNPSINKITILNNGTIEFADLVKIRRGSGATITNAFVGTTGTGTASDYIDFTDCKGNAANSTTVSSQATGTVDGNDIKTSITCEGTNSSTTASVTTITSVGADNVFSWSGVSF